MDRESPGFQPQDESGRRYSQIYHLMPFIYVSHQINPQVSEPVKLDV
nr:MAG TPA: hypothetical protein [Caudoviricetes sp.]